MLIDRRMELLADLEGDLLDLSLLDARAAVLTAARGGDLDRQYDTVLSVAELLRFPDLVQALTGIDRLLVDDGELILVEPVHHPGPAATVLASVWAVHPAVAHVHVERDLALAVRSIGLTVTDLERFTMPTAVWPLRLFVHARVRRITDRVAA
jgi:SAM-dependent methyltransferase